MLNYILIQKYQNGRQDILTSFKDKIEAEKQMQMLQELFLSKKINATLFIKKICGF